MKRKRIFSSLGAILLTLGIVTSSLSYSYAKDTKKDEDKNTNEVHLETYNLEGIKNYMEFSSKVDSSVYQLSIKKDCYVYGWGSDTLAYAANNPGGAETFTFNSTDLSTDTWKQAFERQKDKKKGYKTLFDFYVHSNGTINEKYYADYYLDNEEDMKRFKELKLSDEDKDKYYVSNKYVIKDSDKYDSDENLSKLDYEVSEDEYKALSSSIKSEYVLYDKEHYSVPSNQGINLNSGARLLGSGYNLELDKDIKYYMVYDSYKNYVGTVKPNDIEVLYSDYFSDKTAKPSISAKAIIGDYKGDPYDSVYIDIQYKLGNGNDYIKTVRDAETKEELLISGSSLDSAVSVPIYNAKNKTYKLEVETDMGQKTTVSAKVTDIGKDYKYKKDKDKGFKFDDGTVSSKVPAPKVTITGIEKDTYSSYIKITVKTDIPAVKEFNGTVDGIYSKESNFTVYCNGTYYYSATGENGKETKGSIEINCFKKADEDSTSINYDYDDRIYFDSAGEGYDGESVLPQTGITITMIIVSLLLVGTGLVLLIKGGKFNAKRKK